MKIDRAACLAYLGVKGEPPPEITALIDKYEPILAGAISPRHVQCAMRNSQCAIILQGDDIKLHVQGCEKIILFAATLGLAVDELIRKTGLSDMAGAVTLNAMASAAIEQVADSANCALRIANCELTTRFSPGYGDFPLSVQRDLLAALDAGRKIGLYVNEAGFLLPRKSITAVIGVKY